MTNETELENALGELLKNSRETNSRLVALSQVLGIEIDSESWDKITVEEIAATALFRKTEAEAIISVMKKANSGKGLEKASQFFAKET